jgi:hypothetical protein
MALPAGVPEGILLAVVGGAVALVVRSIRRRKAFVRTVSEDELPDLSTGIRFRVVVRRTWHDAVSGLPMAEIEFSGRKLVVCPVDQRQNGLRWTSLAGKSADLGLYGLATLAPGGADAMRDQIKDFDTSVKSADMSALVRQGEVPCDYVTIGRLLSKRETAWGEMPLDFWRMQCVFAAERGVVFEVAVPRGPDVGLVEGGMAHGSVRLFAYLAD